MEYKRFIVFSSLSMMAAVSSARLPEDELFFWKMGVLLGLHAEESACVQHFPEIKSAVEEAYSNSVFFNSAGEKFLRKELPTEKENKERIELSVVYERAQIEYARLADDRLHPICQDFAAHLEKQTRIAFGIGTNEIKEHLKSEQKPLSGP